MESEQFQAHGLLKMAKNICFLSGLMPRKKSVLVEMIEDRHGLKLIIITSQLLVESWYDVHTAHKIELIGDSVGKINAKKKLWSRIILSKIVLA